MDEIVRQKALVAFQKGVRSVEYQLLMNTWIELLCLRKQVRPPIENVIMRNGIELKLQSVHGRNYRYVPPSKFDETKFCIEPEPLRERILTEIRIQALALEEVKILDVSVPSSDPDSLGKLDEEFC